MRFASNPGLLTLTVGPYAINWFWYVFPYGPSWKFWRGKYENLQRIVWELGPFRIIKRTDGRNWNGR